MSSFTAYAKMKAAQREAALRRNVYPRQITAGKLTVREARQQIDIMLEIAEDYQRIVRQMEAEGLIEREEDGE